MMRSPTPSAGSLPWPAVRATSSGQTSISLTTQSESVPLVEAIRLVIGSPLIFIGSVSTSVVKTSTSGSGRLALVVDQPLGPGEPLVFVAGRFDGTGAEGHRFGGIGDVLVEGFIIGRR